MRQYLLKSGKVKNGKEKPSELENFRHVVQEEVDSPACEITEGNKPKTS